MKLQIQAWPNEAGFMLSVNTHDQVLALDPESSDAQAFRDLQSENQRLKEAIESAWDKAVSPPSLNYLETLHRIPGPRENTQGPPQPRLLPASRIRNRWANNDDFGRDQAGPGVTSSAAICAG